MSTPQLPSFQELYSRIGIHLNEGDDPLLSVEGAERSNAFSDTMETNAPENYSSRVAKDQALRRAEEAVNAWAILESPQEIIRYNAQLVRQEVERLHDIGASQEAIDALEEKSALQMAAWHKKYPKEVRAAGLESVEAAMRHELESAADTHGPADGVIDVEAKEVPAAAAEHVDLGNNSLDQTAAEAAEPTPEPTPEAPAAEATAAPTSEPAPAAEAHTAPPADPAPKLSESRALAVVETAAEKTAAAEAKSHTKTGMIIAAIVGAVGIGAAAWRSREKAREAETSRAR